MSEIGIYAESCCLSSVDMSLCIVFCRYIHQLSYVIIYLFFYYLSATNVFITYSLQDYIDHDREQKYWQIDSVKNIFMNCISWGKFW